MQIYMKDGKALWMNEKAITPKKTAAGETWVIKDDAPVDIASQTLATTNISFTTNNQKATSIGISLNGQFYMLVYGGIGMAAGFGPGISSFFVWGNEAYKTLEFDTAPTGNLRTWLQANGTKQ